MDRTLRAEIREEVAKALRVCLEQMEERWLTADEVCKQFQMFTKDWLEKYGDVLPRKRVKVTHLDGSARQTRWAYPQHEIARNIREGLYDEMKLMRM